MQRIAIIFILSSTMITAAACGRTGDTGTTDEAAPTAATSTTSAGDATGEGLGSENAGAMDTSKPWWSEAEIKAILAEDGDFSADDDRIVGCVSEWGIAPFTRSAVKNYKRLVPAAGGISDTAETAEQLLVLVTADEVSSGELNLELMNPRGWYCLDLDKITYAADKARVHCNAEIGGFESLALTQGGRVGCEDGSVDTDVDTGETAEDDEASEDEE